MMILIGETEIKIWKDLGLNKNMTEKILYNVDRISLKDKITNKVYNYYNLDIIKFNEDRFEVLSNKLL
jgi:hypothetical protein